MRQMQNPAMQDIKTLQGADMKLAIVLFSALFAITATHSFGQEKPHGENKTVNVEKKEMTEGEIKKIDKESGKVTIKHGEIKNLDMPPMTMVFRMKDAAMLDKVKAGDKINFSAEKLNGNYTVTEVEIAK
jgi:Cu(I)/Ag(I) efflux system periplasmic protein CusF